tara:strand:+ start:7153 stop:8202 length:1050 start_codon:yes stop_codon:yes gene_type:complete
MSKINNIKNKENLSYIMKLFKTKLKKNIKNKTTFGNFIKRIYEYLLLLRFYTSSYPKIKTVHLQFTNYCNLNCELCSFSNRQNKQNMSKELLEKILQEILLSGKFKIKELNLWVSGETLLHPDLINMLKIIKEYKNKSGRPLKVKIVTNVMLLTERLSKEIIDLNVVNWIGFSADGGSGEDCEKIRRGSKFDIIVKNIKNFQKINKGKIKTMLISMIPLDKKLETNWMSHEFKELINLVDYCKLNYPLNTGMAMNYPSNFKFDKTNKRVCLALLQSIAIMQDGKVVPCCADFNSKCVLGNLYEQTLFSICKGRKRRKLISDFLKGRKKQIPLCKDCNRFEIPYKIIKIK